MDSLWLENCMISQNFEPSRGRVAKVLVQKLLRAVEAEKQGLKNRVWPPLGHSGSSAHMGLTGPCLGSFMSWGCFPVLPFLVV